MHRSIRPLVLFAALVGLAACDDDTLSPEEQARREYDRTIETVRRVTADYQDLQAALDDGFVFLHPCEERPGEGLVGAVYVHPERLMDGVIDPALPDALVYEPHESGPQLVAAEFAMPFDLWQESRPPELLGHTFQPEEEFGVWALHVWVWRDNPEGMFAEANPNVTC